MLNFPETDLGHSPRPAPPTILEHSRHVSSLGKQHVRDCPHAIEPGDATMAERYVNLLYSLQE